MDHVRQIVRMLHDEHLSTLSLLERFETLLRAYRLGLPAEPAADGELSRMMREIETLIASGLAAHFDFEENSLFPLLEPGGDAAIGVLLAEEHASIRVTAGQLATLCHAVCAGKASEADWRDIRRLGFDFAQQITGHIQKEEIGLLETLDDAVDEGQDADLVMAYSAVR